MHCAICWELAKYTRLSTGDETRLVAVPPQKSALDRLIALPLPPRCVNGYNRPMKLTIGTNGWPVIGHELTVGQLRRAVQSGAVAHAYLLSGPARIGKEHLALTFAQALLCTAESSAKPCGHCRACTLVAQRKHPDFLTLDMAWQGAMLPDKKSAQSITVDAVRLMNSELARSPHEGHWKVLLVPEAEGLTTQAANAFLKTLEEPPDQVVILMTSRDAELVLPTIRSRCQPLPMRPLPLSRVADALRQQGQHSEERTRLLARLSGGRIGWALQAQRDDTLLTRRAEALEAHGRLLRANRAERLLAAADLSKGDHALDMLQTWAGWWRDLLLVQSGAASRISNIDQRAELDHLSHRLPPTASRAFLRELQRLLAVLETTNANGQLVWEVLLLKLPSLSGEWRMANGMTD